MSLRLLTIICISIALVGATCDRIPEDRTSAFASEAGQATMVLGGCAHALTLGWESCLVTRNQHLPQLRLVFTNAAEYHVSDCVNGGILRQGSVSGPAEVLIDLSSIEGEIHRRRICILDVEAVEFYEDPAGGKEQRPIPLIGGFYIQSIEPGYISTPPPATQAFCYKVRRTTKGRTTLDQEACR